jgi:hypothetical protein
MTFWLVAAALCAGFTLGWIAGIAYGVRREQDRLRDFAMQQMRRDRAKGYDPYDRDWQE